MQTISPRRLALPELPTLATGAAVVGIAAALIILPPLYSAILLAGVALSAIVIARPRWGFYLLLLSIPAQDLGAVGELTATNVVFGLTLVAWLARRLAFGGEPLPRAAVGPIFALFVGGLAISLVVAQNLAPGIAALFQWVKALLVYFLALDLLRTRRQTLGAIVALTLAGVAEGAVGLVQYLTGVGPESFAIGAQFSRAFGTFGRPNSYAGYLEMILPLAAALAYLALARRSTPRSSPTAATGDERSTPTITPPAPTPTTPPRPHALTSLLPLAAAALIAAAIFASFSRGAWLGTTGAALVAVLLLGGRARAAAAIGAVLLGLILLAGGSNLLPEDFTERLATAVAGVDTPDVRTAFVTAENFATLERKAHWEAGLAMFADNRLLGVGLGNFNDRFAEYTVSPTFLISQGHAHNYYIHVAAEAGIVGAATYLLLVATILVTMLRALRLASRPGGDRAARIVVIACLAVVTAVAIHNFFENLHVLSMGVQLSTIWALPTIVTQRSWSAAPEQTTPPGIAREEA